MLIAQIPTAVVVDGQRSIVQPGQLLPPLTAQDQAALLASGAAITTDNRGPERATAPVPTQGPERTLAPVPQPEPERAAAPVPTSAGAKKTSKPKNQPKE